MSCIRLVGIQIDGFRAFPRHYEASFRTPLDEPTDVMVIAGPNGAGKSSLLEAVLLAMGREALIRNSLSAEAAEGHWRTSVPDAASIVLTFDVASAPGTELGAYAPCEVQVMRSAAVWRLDLLREGQPPQPMPDPILRQFVEEYPMEYFSSWRTPYQLGGVHPSVQASEMLQDERHRLYRLKQRIISERAKRGFSDRDTLDRAWIERLNVVWRDWHETAETWIDALETGDTARPFDLFIVRDSEEMGPQPICPLDMASSGELEWITLTGLLIVEAFDGLLVIDEPELHLHPQWQARLLPTLRKLAPGAQMLVATHSAYPWDQVLSFQRILLLPPNDPREAGEP